MENPEYIMVLNDGETFTSLAGCTVVRVTDAIRDQIDYGELRASMLGEEEAVFTFTDAPPPALSS